MRHQCWTGLSLNGNKRSACLQKMGDKKNQLPEKWKQEDRTIRAVQIAFDLEEKIQRSIRQEALDLGINPSDRIRQILGLTMIRKPKRLRLSISLSDEDFVELAEQFNIDVNDRVKLKHYAAEQLVKHVKAEQDDN
jgi:hypothetical protein